MVGKMTSRAKCATAGFRIMPMIFKSQCKWLDARAVDVGALQVSMHRTVLWKINFTKSSFWSKARKLDWGWRGWNDNIVKILKFSVAQVDLFSASFCALISAESLCIMLWHCATSSGCIELDLPPEQTQRTATVSYLYRKKCGSFIVNGKAR